MILPVKEAIELKCFGQSEARNIKGTFLCQIQKGCQIITNSETIINDQKPIQSNNQPILFPDDSTTDTLLPVLDTSRHLPDLKLDGLHRIRNEIFENQPHVIFNEIRKTPSLFTILLYIEIFIFCLFNVYKKIMPKIKRRKPKKSPEQK